MIPISCSFRGKPIQASPVFLHLIPQSSENGLYQPCSCDTTILDGAFPSVKDQSKMLKGV